MPQEGFGNIMGRIEIKRMKKLGLRLVGGAGIGMNAKCAMNMLKNILLPRIISSQLGEGLIR